MKTFKIFLRLTFEQTWVILLTLSAQVVCVILVICHKALFPHLYAKQEFFADIKNYFFLTISDIMVVIIGVVVAVVVAVAVCGVTYWIKSNWKKAKQLSKEK